MTTTDNDDNNENNKKQTYFSKIWNLWYHEKTRFVQTVAWLTVLIKLIYWIDKYYYGVSNIAITYNLYTHMIFYQQLLKKWMNDDISQFLSFFFEKKRTNDRNIPSESKKRITKSQHLSQKQLTRGCDMKEYQNEWIWKI